MRRHLASVEEDQLIRNAEAEKTARPIQLQPWLQLLRRRVVLACHQGFPLLQSLKVRGVG